VLASLVAFCVNSQAMNANSARALYVDGDYNGAIEAAEREPNGESLAAAARAAIADANLRDRPCLTCLERAEALARRAIAAEPARVESHVLLAVTLGYKARIVGMLRARLANYAEQAKTELETALRLAPNDGSALAAFGGWHIEVVRLAGWLGTALYGARLETGKQYYRRGIAADPDNLVLKFQFALSLAGYDLNANRDDVDGLLTAAAAGLPRTAYERVLKSRAAQLLEAVRRNPRAALALVNTYQGYP
jgi:hypothetical protein